MTVPGVGPVVALTYRATVDVPARFRNSKAVGAVFGLTPARYQSGESDRTRRDIEVRRRDDAGNALRRRLISCWCVWRSGRGSRPGRCRSPGAAGLKKATVALARRLAVILHRIWVDGTEFRWTREQAAAAA